jgi:hypothetical protein
MNRSLPQETALVCGTSSRSYRELLAIVIGAFWQSRRQQLAVQAGLLAGEFELGNITDDDRVIIVARHIGSGAVGIAIHGAMS